MNSKLIGDLKADDAFVAKRLEPRRKFGTVNALHDKDEVGHSSNSGVTGFCAPRLSQRKLSQARPSGKDLLGGWTTEPVLTADE